MKLSYRGEHRESLIMRERGPSIDLAAIDSIWYRRPGPFSVNPMLSPQARHFALAEAEMALNGMLRNADVFWMNHPAAINEARYKPVQLDRAGRAGLRIPDTIITNDPDAAYDFAVSHPKGVIVKVLDNPHVRPVPGDQVAEGVILTTKVNACDRSAFTAVQHTACLLQELIPKKYDIRVVIAGTEVFAVAIYSQAHPCSVVDWRAMGTALRHEVIELPEWLRDTLLELVHSLGLAYAAIDLVKAEDDSYVFLEINPNGQWEWLEVLTSSPIADAIAATLTSRR
jgi:glutathione synthase/RimK-type ligase-like ATP-grasp enzyme